MKWLRNYIAKKPQGVPFFCPVKLLQERSRAVLVKRKSKFKTKTTGFGAQQLTTWILLNTVNFAVQSFKKGTQNDYKHKN